MRNAVGVGKDGMLAWGAWLGAQALPDEWVLRQLHDADLEDDTVVAALLSDYGRVKGPYFAAGFIPDDARAKLGYDGGTTGFEGQPGFPDHDGTTIGDARWYLKTARALARSWARAMRDEDPTTVWAEEGFSLVPESEDIHWATFTHRLNEGLEPYHAHTAIKDWGAGSVLLYSAACLQVFNLVVGECDAVRCENETCGRTFVHQQGGSRFGQHRTKGLRYCSVACGSAQAARQYRRRKAAKEDKP